MLKIDQYYCYNINMKTKSLRNTNPYLKDAAQCRKYVARSVISSCGVEGIKLEENTATGATITHRKNKKIYKLLKMK